MTKPKDDISFEEVSSKLSYDPEMGLLSWKARSGPKSAGDIAGHVTKLGYIRVGLNGRLYAAHRLIWLLHYGVWPKDEIDHRDGCRSNNRIANLRPADESENAQNQKVPRNNTSGFKGVCWHNGTGKWRVNIRAFGNVRFLGLFENIEDAAARYLKASNDLHSEFGRVA